MATLARVEDIRAWQKARDLCRLIYQISSQAAFAKDYALRDQIRRAGISILSNIAEGFGRGGNREFIQFLGQARGSAVEAKSQLYIALDCSYISQGQFDSLYQLITEIEKLLAGFIQYLQQAAYKGSKFIYPANPKNAICEDVVDYLERWDDPGISSQQEDRKPKS